MGTLFLILPVKVLLHEQDKYCLNLNVIRVEEEEMTASTVCILQGWVYIIHAIFNPISLFVANQAGIILSVD